MLKRYQGHEHCISIQRPRTPVASVLEGVDATLNILQRGIARSSAFGRVTRHIEKYW